MFLYNCVQLLVQIRNPHRKRQTIVANDLASQIRMREVHIFLCTVRCLDTGINCPFPFTNKTYIHTIQPTEIANYLVKLEYVSLMKQQFFVTHTFHQTEIFALLDSWVTNTSSVKMMCTRKTSLSLHCHKTITCLNVGLLRISLKFFSVSCNTVYWWVTTNYCFMCDMLFCFWVLKKIYYFSWDTDIKMLHKCNCKYNHVCLYISLLICKK